jgi:hypothetical protein
MYTRKPGLAALLDRYSMNDITIGQAEEQTLIYEVSDEALEAVAGGGAHRAAFTEDACTNPFTSCAR